MKEKNRRISRLNEMLEMPKEIYSNEPKITCLGFKELFIENYKSILDYQDIYIRIYTYIGILGIEGRNLELMQMTKDDLKIIGEIEKIEFEKLVEEE